MAAPATTDQHAARIVMRDVGKSYETPAGAFAALSKVTLLLRPSEFVAIVGKSGSGKSTLINLLTGIDRPTAGEISVAGEAVTGKTETELARWRGRNVGIVFQFFQLLPTLTALENAMLPLDFSRRVPKRERGAGAGYTGRRVPSAA